MEKEATLSLIRKIGNDSDQEALNEFLERYIFYRNGKNLRLPEFILALKECSDCEPKSDKKIRPHREWIYDDVYDLTLAKFYNFPLQIKNSLNSENLPNKVGFTWQVDCRLYFKELLREIELKLNEKQIKGEIEIEQMVAIIATWFVIKHFYLSLRECRRRVRSWKRFAWRVNGRTFYLYYPFYLIPPKQFLNWLETNITDVNPKAPFENIRIQEIINQTFPRLKNIQMEDHDFIDLVGGRENLLVEHREGEQFIEKLSSKVAREKADNLKKQRPAIRRLGWNTAYNLVNRVFSDLADEKYELSKVARDFGLSTATLSRFAGSDWFKAIDQKSGGKIPNLKTDKGRLSADQPGSMETAKNAESEGVKNVDQKSKIKIPDLWANTAHVLAGEPLFMETFENSKFAGVLDKVLKLIKPERPE